ncbi:MAG: single-stranded-DNA-specific exonuclease RecJ [Chloroflexi bacterium]|nr:single-stranded-DNA-specific exonuclease RecJ [Chloroflexota bacterium]
MNRKQWRFLPPPPAGFSRQIGLSPFQAHLLHNRDIKDRAQAELYFSKDLSLLHNPFLLPDMEKAINRLRLAFEAKEAIGIFGDFDTDGVTGTALLIRTFDQLGVRAIPYIPHRVEEGHGLNIQAIKDLKSDGASLLITVDCGTTSVEEVKFARSIGMDVIITDHHSIPPALPEACAVINPNRPDSSYPFKGLAGVGLAFKLAQAIYQTLQQPYPHDYLELVALGTIADVAPLKGENRTLVSHGLRELNFSKSPGLNHLMASASIEQGNIDTETLAFGLIPRLNAAGRLEHAQISLDLLTSKLQEEAIALSKRLENMNHQRRSLTEEASASLRPQIQAQLNKERILVVGGEDLSPGILGLVASRLVDEFYRPAIVFSKSDGLIRASARSIPEFNITSALSKCSDMFIRFGGHPQAAGFTMDGQNLPMFQDKISVLAFEKLEGLDLTPSIRIDAQAPISLFDADNFKFLQSMAPFGQGNHMPVLLTRKVEICEVLPVGSDTQHLSVKLKQGNRIWKAMAFRSGDRIAELQGKMDMVLTVAAETWRSQETLRLNILDFRPSR